MRDAIRDPAEAFASSDPARIFDGLMVEEPHEQMAALPRRLRDHPFKRGAQAMTHVGTDRFVHRTRYIAIIRTAHSR